MVRVSQFVLFACITIVSSFSQKRTKNSQYDLDESIENDEYDAYIDDLISKLSSKEIELMKIHQKIDVEDRLGNSGNCNMTIKAQYPRHATGTDFKETLYRVVNSRKNLLQSVDFQICIGKDDNKDFSCSPTMNDHFYMGCCVQKQQKATIYVVSEKYKNSGEIEDLVETAKDTKIKGTVLKEAYFDSLCDCKSYSPTAQEYNENITNEEFCKFK